MTSRTGRIRPGRSFPLGATVQASGTNFCVFSRNCESVELLLFDSVDAEPTDVIELDPDIHRTFYYWHIFLEGVGHG
jgi:glycogen operon protein